MWNFRAIKRSWLRLDLFISLKLVNCLKSYTIYKIKHIIPGHNIHLPASKKFKTKWFIYSEECEHPEGTYQYVGYTDSMTYQLANAKSKCKSNSRDETVKSGTGLEKHIRKGCSPFNWPEMKPAKVTFLEKFNTTEAKLWESRHVARAGCQCSQCLQLEKMEDALICRMGTYHGMSWLNEREKISNKAKATYWRGHGGNMAHTPSSGNLLTSIPTCPLGEEASLV